MEQNRWKSPVLWAAILAQVIAILMLSGLVTGEQVTLIEKISAAVLQLLVLFGIINSPTNKDSL